MVHDFTQNAPALPDKPQNTATLHLARALQNTYYKV